VNFRGGALELKGGDPSLSDVAGLNLPGDATMGGVSNLDKRTEGGVSHLQTSGLTAGHKTVVSLVSPVNFCLSPHQEETWGWG